MRRVLVCTEEGILYLYLRRIVLAAGALVTAHADSPYTAVPAADQFKPDLIFMDNWFSAGSGIQAARDIALPVRRPVVLLSDTDEETRAYRDLPGVVSGVLQRPFNHEDVLRVVAGVSLPYQAAEQMLEPLSWRSCFERNPGRDDGRIRSCTYGDWNH